MDFLFLLNFILLISFGLTMIFTVIFIGLKRRRILTNTLDNQTQKTSVFLDIINYASGFFSATKNEVTEKFIGAGFYNTTLAPYYFLLKYILCSMSILIILFAGKSLGIDTTSETGIWLSITVVIIVIIPDTYLELRRRELAKKITRKLPYLLDMMGVCIQTGMTIEASLFYLTTEMASFDRDIAFMLKRLRDRSQIVGLTKALQELHTRIPSPEIHSFVMTLTQSMQHGTSIYEVLSTLAKDIREIQLLALEEKAGKLSSKMSIPLILFIMFPIVILITAPGLMRIMQ